MIFGQFWQQPSQYFAFGKADTTVLVVSYFGGFWGLSPLCCANMQKLTAPPQSSQYMGEVETVDETKKVNKMTPAQMHRQKVRLIKH